MSFWREELVEFALDHETRKHMEEQVAWIEREPANAQPYYALAQFYRMNGNEDYALGLLLEAVRLKPELADGHASLCEIYAIRGDNAAAWRHARAAERLGLARGVELLTKYGIAESFRS
jgi:cytochrome c-type biogenesis protein CcmH/NrfG